MFTTWDLWRTARLVVGVAVLIAAAYYLVVAFDNITNLDSNWAFVRGVLTFDGVPANSGFDWRRTESEAFAVVAYAVIIAGETVAGLLLAWGGIRALRTTASPAAWANSQRLALLGCACGLLVFWFGFIVVAGNWWIMYLNSKWNGLEPAFQNAALTALTAISILVVAVAGKDERPVAATSSVAATSAVVARAEANRHRLPDA